MKKIILTLIMVTMLMGICAVPAFAGGEYVGSYIKIDDGIKRPIDEAASGNGWIYNENCVLILDNYNGGEIYFYSNYETRKNLTIILKGKNTVNGKIYSGSNTTAYGIITVTSDENGSVSAHEIDGAPFIFDSCTASTGGVLPEYYEVRVQNGAVLNVDEDCSGGSLSDKKICVDGGTLNIYNAQESYLNGKENLTIQNGGVLNISSSDDTGAILCRYDSSALTDFLVTDFSGNRLIVKENLIFPDAISGKLVNPSDPETPVMKVRITEYVTLSRGGNRIADWAEADINSVIDENLMPTGLEGKDLRNPISRAEFAEAAVLLYEKMSGETVNAAEIPFEDLEGVSETLTVNIAKAYEAELMNGMSDTEFYPEAKLTREQAATILYRICEKLGGGSDKSTPAFSDDDSISPWARDAVYFMAGNDIIKGMGDNLFDPKSDTQAQQALIIALRMFRNIK